MARAQFYSQYKRHYPIKVLISSTQLGAINYISKRYGGRASDMQITKESGFTTSKYHMPGDQILADRGFTMKSVQTYMNKNNTQYLLKLQIFLFFSEALSIFL